MDDSAQPPTGSAEVTPRVPTQTWARRVALDLRSRFAPDHLVRPGQNIGKYVLGEPIARGGMAEVWGARVEGPQGFVKSLALKFILESFSGDSELERLFVNEARLAAQLQHANLVTVFDFDKIADPDGSSVGRYYIAMERIDGHDLRRLLQTAAHRGRRLTPAIALHIAGEVLKGLRYVHDKRDPETHLPMGLIHRDVSPHNILVGFAGEVKLSDFGIAKAMTQNLGTQSGTIRGKLAYASPEQLRAEPIDHRTDQFALGVTLWEALAGQRLFEGADELAVMSKVISGVIPPLPVAAGVPRATETIVRRMLSTAAKDRYPSTAEALSAIMTAQAYTPDGAPLAALMRELYQPDPLADLPRTAPLDAAALAATPLAGAAGAGPSSSDSPSPRGGGTLRHDAFGETRPLERDASERDASARAPSERENAERGRSGRSPSGSRRTPLPEPTREPTRSVTGSAYVSGAIPNEEFRVARGRPATWVALGVLGAGALTGAVVLVGRRGPTANSPLLDQAVQEETAHAHRKPGRAPEAASVLRSAAHEPPVEPDPPAPDPREKQDPGKSAAGPGVGPRSRATVDVRVDRDEGRDSRSGSRGAGERPLPTILARPPASGSHVERPPVHKSPGQLPHATTREPSERPTPEGANHDVRPLLGAGTPGTSTTSRLPVVDTRTETTADVTPPPGPGPTTPRPLGDKPSPPAQSGPRPNGVTPNDAPVLK